MVYVFVAGSAPGQPRSIPPHPLHGGLHLLPRGGGVPPRLATPSILLPGDHVVRPKQVPAGAGPHRVHHLEAGPGDEPAGAGLGVGLLGAPPQGGSAPLS